MSLRCLRQRNNHVFGSGFNGPFSPVKIAALRHGSSDRNANTASTRTALAKFDWVFWGSYSVTNLEANIADIRAQAGKAQIHSKYVLAQQAAGQFHWAGNITRSGTTVTYNVEDEYGVAKAPDSTIAVGRVVTIANAAVTAYNGDWSVTKVNATSFEFTATGGAATAVDDTSKEAVACSVTSVSHDLCQKLASEKGWFLWKVGTSGRRLTGIPGFGAMDMNQTSWAGVDGNGDNWVQWKAKRDNSTFFNLCNGFDYVYIDNYLDPRPDLVNDVQYPGQRTKVDFKQTGTPQDITDADVLSAHRTGNALFAQTFRLASASNAKSANLKCIGNHDDNLPGEYANSLESVFLEGVTGRSWSQDTQHGFTAALNYYKGVRQGLMDPSNGIVLFCTLLTTKSQGRDGGPNDYSRARYSYCMSQLIGQPNNTYLSIKADDDDAGAFMYDEYNAQLGNPVDPDQTAAWSGAAWRRRFQNGCVIVNSSHTASVTVDLTGQGYKRLNAASYGNQNATVNNGQPVTGLLTIGPWDGIVLIKE